MMGYASERQHSLGVPATPYLVLGLTCVIAFFLFVLTLAYFIRNNKKCLTFASIAGIGGYLVNPVLALIFDLETKSLGSQLMIFLLFAVPMIAIFLYRRMEQNAGRI